MVRRAAGDRRQATAGPLPPLRHSPPPPGLSASPPPVHLRPPALHGSKADGSSAPPPTVRHCLRRRSGLHLCRTPPPSGSHSAHERAVFFLCFQLCKFTCGRPISTRQLRQHHNMWHLRSLEMEAGEEQGERGVVDEGSVVSTCSPMLMCTWAFLAKLGLKIRCLGTWA